MQSPHQHPVWVVHHLPGRTRLAWRGLYIDQRGAQRMARHLSGQSGIREAWASHRSGRLLVHHDQSMSMTQVLDMVRKGVKVIANLTGDAPDDPEMDTIFSPEPEDQTLGRHFSRVGGVGSLLLYLLVRRKVSGPSRLSTSPFIFNLMAATALAAGYPNIKNGLRYLSGRRAAGHDFLLSLATLTVLFLGEGFLGLTVIWLVNVTDMVQALLWQKTRQAFPLPDRRIPAAKPDQFTKAARAYADRVAGLTLAGGILAGVAASDFRRTLAVLLAANPSAAGLIAPAAFTAAAARARSLGVSAGNRGAMAALAGMDTLVIGPGRKTGLAPRDFGNLASIGLRVAPVQDTGSRAFLSQVERLQAEGAKVAVIGQVPEDLEAMQKAYLAMTFRDAPPEVLAGAAVFLPDSNPGPLVEARRLAQAAANRTNGGLSFVRMANLTGLALAAAGWLPPTRGAAPPRKEDRPGHRCPGPRPNGSPQPLVPREKPGPIPASTAFPTL